MEKYRGEKIALAVSGGADSTALMHLCAELGLDFVVLHVNHKLRPESEAEAAHVKSLPFDTVVLEWNGVKPRTGLEESARNARYGLMTDWCHKNGVGVLAVAHQADDNIETFLMNLRRGSGIYGLAGIRAVASRDGIKIIRPLLGIPRAALEKYCADFNHKYFHDAMNDDEKYTRVKIRKNRRVLRDALGITDERMLLAIANLARARESLESMAARGDFWEMPAELQLKFLGDEIRRIGKASYAPRLQSLQKLLYALLAAPTVRRTLGNCIITRKKNEIKIEKEI